MKQLLKDLLQNSQQTLWLGTQHAGNNHIGQVSEKGSITISDGNTNEVYQLSQTLYVIMYNRKPIKNGYMHILNGSNMLKSET